MDFGGVGQKLLGFASGISGMREDQLKDMLQSALSSAGTFAVTKGIPMAMTALLASPEVPVSSGDEDYDGVAQQYYLR